MLAVHECCENTKHYTTKPADFVLRVFVASWLARSHPRAGVRASRALVAPAPAFPSAIRARRFRTAASGRSRFSARRSSPPANRSCPSKGTRWSSVRPRLSCTCVVITWPDTVSIASSRSPSMCACPKSRQTPTSGASRSSSTKCTSDPARDSSLGITSTATRTPSGDASRCSSSTLRRARVTVVVARRRRLRPRQAEVDHEHLHRDPARDEQRLLRFGDRRGPPVGVGARQRQRRAPSPADVTVGDRRVHAVQLEPRVREPLLQIRDSGRVVIVEMRSASRRARSPRIRAARWRADGRGSAAGHGRDASRRRTSVVPRPHYLSSSMCSASTSRKRANRRILLEVRAHVAKRPGDVLDVDGVSARHGLVPERAERLQIALERPSGRIGGGTRPPDARAALEREEVGDQILDLRGLRGRRTSRAGARRGRRCRGPAAHPGNR